MSVSIRSCPGCDALILADTIECPDCGHVFDEDKASQLKGDHRLASAELEDPCPDCGAMVRAGLVRCPECSRFMRDDIAKKYDALQAAPQPIIYSDIAPGDRDEYLPPRKDTNAPTAKTVSDDADAGFEIGAGVVMGASDSPAEDDGDSTFELGRTNIQEAAAEAPKPTAETAAAPSDAPAASDDTAPGSSTPPAAAGSEAAARDLDVDSLLNIAREDEKETIRRKVERKRRDKARSILVPCTCGAWLRVREHQMGKTVRCRKCRRMLPIPQLARKGPAKNEAKKDVELPWLTDIDFAEVDPSNLRLKPGSLAGSSSPVDVLLSSAGIAICQIVQTKGKSGLFGKAREGARSPEETRAAIREYLASDGAISTVPAEKTTFVPAESVGELLIVQPVRKAHESMFAGVPVFGEGRIAVLIPGTSEKDPEQHFLSFGLTDFRFFSAQLERLFGVAEFGKAQGVPSEDQRTALKCHYSGNILNALADITWYEADRHVELTLIGRKCGACGIAVSEDSRKSHKIGGASGRGLSRAKCPKCNGKFGNHPLYTFELKGTAPKLGGSETSADDDSTDSSAELPASPAGA